MRSNLTSTGTTTPSFAAPSARSAIAGENSSQAVAIAAAAADGTSPTDASARASALSNASMARMSASTEKQAATSASPSRGERIGLSKAETVMGLFQMSKKIVSCSPCRRMSKA